MHQQELIINSSYALMLKQVQALLKGETDPIANMANLSAFLFHSLTQINWVGFYRLMENELIVGPFMGKPACVHIAIGSGVCGSSVSRRKTLIVENVHQFPGHIACDSDSNSEIVIPLLKQGKILGVLDLDSQQLGRFKVEDKTGLEAIVNVLIATTNF